jgi:hypothetical protein
MPRFVPNHAERFHTERVTECYPKIYHVFLASRIIPIVANNNPVIKAHPLPNVIASTAKKKTASQIANLMIVGIPRHELAQAQIDR